LSIFVDLCYQVAGLRRPGSPGDFAEQFLWAEAHAGILLLAALKPSDNEIHAPDANIRT